MGMNMTTAFTIFTKTAVRQEKIPFEVADDPFYSETNQARLREAVKGMDAGQGIVRKTMQELEAMENE
jgi:DNA-damage-inducible protein J